MIFQDFKKMKKAPKINKFFQNFEKTLLYKTTLIILKTKYQYNLRKNLKNIDIFKNLAYNI